MRNGCYKMILIVRNWKCRIKFNFKVVRLRYWKIRKKKNYQKSREIKFWLPFCCYDFVWTYSLCSAARSLCRLFLNQFDICCRQKVYKLAIPFIFVGTDDLRKKKRETYLHCCETCPICQFPFFSRRWIWIMCVPFTQNWSWLFLPTKIRNRWKWGKNSIKKKRQNLLWNNSSSLRRPKSYAVTEICV